MLYESEYIGEVEVLIECNDNLTSFVIPTSYWVYL